MIRAILATLALAAALAGCSAAAPPPAPAPPATTTAAAPTTSSVFGNVQTRVTACGKLGAPGATRTGAEAATAEQWNLTAEQATATVDRALDELCPYLKP